MAKEVPQPLLHAPKTVWRRWAKEQQAASPSTVAEAAATCAHLTSFLRQRGVRSVLAYRALPGELDLSALAPHFRLLTTRAHFGNAQTGIAPHLTLHAWESATQPSRFGAMQPPLGTPQVAREAIDAVLLPGLAFDLCGARLGYGGGFYDRLLATWSVLSIGVISAKLLVSALPTEPHDCRVTYLATGRGVQRAEVGG